VLKKSLLIASVLSLSLLTNCAHMPDEPACVEIHNTKGWCTNMVSDVEFYVDEKRPHSFSGDPKDAKTWWEVRPFMVLIPFDSWAKLKAYLIKNCKRTNCDKYIKSWERKINRIDDKAKNE